MTQPTSVTAHPTRDTAPATARVALRDCPAGAEVVLRGLGVPADQRLRLVELGFVPGRSIRVVGRGISGGLVVALGDARVAIDAATSGLLQVERLGGDA